MRRATFIFIALAAVNLVAVDELHYSVDEIELLVKKKSWNEAILHLPDVIPGQRDSHWDGLVEKASLGFLQSQTDQKTGDQTSVDLLKTFPSLERSRAFTKKSHELGLAALSYCYKIFKKEECGTRALEFAQAWKFPRDLTLAAGRLVGERQGAAEAFPLFRELLAKSGDAKLCADRDVHQSIFGALALKDGAGREQARVLASELCWLALQVPIEKEVDRGPASYLGESLCQILKEKGKMNEAREAKCHSLGAQPSTP